MRIIKNAAILPSPPFCKPAIILLLEYQEYTKNLQLFHYILNHELDLFFICLRVGMFVLNKRQNTSTDFSYELERPKNVFLGIEIK